MLHYLRTGRNNVTPKVAYALEQAEQSSGQRGKSNAQGFTGSPDAKGKKRKSASREFRLWKESVFARLETLSEGERRDFIETLRNRFSR